MATREIPRTEWVKGLDRFSRAHENWVVYLELIGRQLGDQEMSTKLPLVGIAADVKGGASRIIVSLGGRPDAHLDRVVDKAKRLWLTESDDRTHDSVAIEADDGTKTVVHFRHVDPTQTDRLLPRRPPGTT